MRLGPAHPRLEQMKQVAVPSRGPPGATVDREWLMSRGAGERVGRAAGGPTLLAVPNISEGRDGGSVSAIAKACAVSAGVRLLDVHSDPDHHRSVITLAGKPSALGEGLLAGVKEALSRLDVGHHRREEEIGQHPHVGAVDVAPIVYLDEGARGAACALALVVAHETGALGVPVFLYGELADGRSRAELRRGGVREMARKLSAGELRPDFGPHHVHPTAGVTLVAAREPLVAFNLELAPPATLKDARRIAAAIREGGTHGLPGVRAIGVELGRRVAPAGAEGVAVAQVSINVERPLELPLRELVRAVGQHADVISGELVGLAPAAALEGFPGEIELRGFDPSVQVIENALGFS
jgi:glutamate formiminotransferase / 5-formyltetrahydrofolate cyclo-ligase